MSRSYKHTPHTGLGKSKFAKREANLALRRRRLSDAFMKGTRYKKLYSAYDISDYEVSESFERYYARELNRWAGFYRHVRGEKRPDRQSCWREFQKRYIRK